MLKRIILFICLIMLSVTLCGCVALLAGAAGGAGTAYWLSEKLTQDVNTPYNRVIQATHKALDSLKLPLIKETTSAEVTQIISKDINSKTIWIDLKPTTKAATRIEVRVGAAKSDKKTAHEIMNKIQRYL